MTLIIFEGCDKTGKSTLIKSLFKRDDSVFHTMHPYKPYEEYAVYIKSQYQTIAALSKNFIRQHLILDRFLLSEWCYSQLDRGKKIKEKDLSYILEIDKQIAGNAVLIYTEAHIKVILERLKNDSDKEVWPIDISILLDVYNDYLKFTKIPYIRVDTTNKSMHECCEDISRFFNVESINIRELNI